MFDYIFAMGPLGELNIIILTAILIMALRNAYVLFISRNTDRIAKLGRSINAMLFWGALMLLLGFFGTFMGATGMFDALAGMVDMDPRVLMGGISQLLLLINFSMGSFIVVAIVWYFLSWRHRRLLADSLRKEYVTRPKPDNPSAVAG